MPVPATVNHNSETQQGDTEARTAETGHRGRSEVKIQLATKSTKDTKGTDAKGRVFLRRNPVVPVILLFLVASSNCVESAQRIDESSSDSGDLNSGDSVSQIPGYIMQ